MRLLVVDDHEVVRRGVRSLLSEQPGWDVCGEAVDGHDAVEKARDLNPDVVVMDVSMPVLNGLEATRQIRKLSPQCEVLILSQHDSSEMARQALKAGARGYVVKSSIAKDLVSAVKKVQRREYFFDPAILNQGSSTLVDVQEILQRSAAFEQALRESEELYRSTFELTAVGIAHVSPEGKWLRLNHKFCEIVGYSEAELLGLTFQDITHPEDLDADLSQAERVRKGELQTYSMEKRYLRKDGSAIWINLTVSAVRDSNGNLMHFIAVVEDINERKTAREALQDSRQQLVLALQSSKSAMFDWDLVRRRGKWNPEMTAIYGFQPKDEFITAEEWLGLFHPDDSSRLMQEAERFWNDSRQMEFSFEFRTMPRDGESKWVTSHGRIVRDRDGNAVRMIGIHTDITDRKRAEKILRERQDELNEAQRLAKIGSWHWTPATDTVTWSDELYRIAGRDPRSPAISYADHHTLYTPESWSRLQAAVNDALKLGTPYSVELEMIRADGEKRWVIATGESQKNSQGAVIGLRGTVQDISERKSMEQEIRMAEERMRFSLEAANIGTWDWNIPTGKVSWSSNMEAVHGQAPGSFGSSFDSFLQGVFEDDRERVLQEINRALSGERTYRVQYRQYRADGTVGWMEACGRVELDDQGRPRRMFGICADITERKRVEEEVRQSESRLRAAFSQSYSYLVLLEPDGTIVEANRAALDAAGVKDASAVIGKKFWEPWWSPLPEEVANLKNIVAKVAAGQSVRDECYFCLPDGSRRVGDRTLSPVFDQRGQVTMIVATGLDITERKQAGDVLRESEQRYKAITEASPIMVWMAGADKLCYYFNKGWLDFAGRSLEQELGNGWAENVHPEDFERCLQTYVSSFDARQPFEMQYRLRHHSGQYRWILDRGVPRYAPDGTFEGYVGGCLDIHDQKEAAEKVRRADEALRLMRVQDQERRHIARELHDTAGQTLAVLGITLAQLIDKLAHVAPDLLKDGQQVEELVRQLHQEIRTTSYLLHPPLLDERGLAPALSWYVQGLIERGVLDVTLEIPENFGRLPAELELAIFRVVQECLTNVHRHSGSHSASIRISNDDDVICVEVSDQGKGINPSRLQEIQSGGAGVGVRGMQERLRQFGGELRIEAFDTGTTVTARIPTPKEIAPTQAEPLQAAV